MQKYILIKAAIVSFIGLLLLIPVNMVKYKVNERQDFQMEARRLWRQVGLDSNRSLRQ